MSRLLNIDEMYDILIILENPRRNEFKERLEAIAEDMAGELRNTLNIASGIAECNGADEGGTMVAFSPLKANDELPTALSGYDKDGDWEVYEGPYERQYPDGYGSDENQNANNTN
jgi:hypothetical protein